MVVFLEYIFLYIQLLSNVMVRYIMLMKKVLSKLMMLLIWMRLMWQLLEENVQNMLEEQVQILLKVINYF